MNYKCLIGTLILALSASIGKQSRALAQWSHDPNANNAIATAANGQGEPTIVGDGAGGAIITWNDYRSGTNYDIYAQRVNSSGAVQWTVDGVPISTAAYDQQVPMIVSDGAGGAIITWNDHRNGANYDIYAQRINSSGVVQWTTDGVPICTAADNQVIPMIVGDGSGGVIITWNDYRSGTNYDIYAQRVNSSGAVQWTVDGVPISTAANAQTYPIIVGDGAGGVIITWQDSRNGASSDIYAQRVNSSGAAQWTADGVPISTAANNQVYPTIASDGSGGGIIIWQDIRSGTSHDIYAQRVNSSGVVQWTTDGVPICIAANAQYNPVIAGNGTGGGIITWQDYRSGTNYDIYAQRVNSSGVAQWTGDGVPISTAASHQTFPMIASDGFGGAIITWYDSHIYAQRVSSSGVAQWTGDGVPISTATGGQSNPRIIVDGAGGAIITWQATRSGSYSDIYAQRVDKIGYLGKNEPLLTTVRDVPGDQGGKVSITWNSSSYDAFPYNVVTYYSVWRGVETAGLSQSAKPILPGEMTLDFSGKAYRVIESAAGEIYWEWIGNVTSHYFDHYSFTAPTLADSGPTGMHTGKYLVSAQTNNQFVFWDSNVDSGYSVDNLPPGAVLSLIAQLQPGPSIQVHWPPDIIDPDVGYYEVHRSTTSGFLPDQSTNIGQTADTLMVDTSPVNGAMSYYRVITVDIHGNRSVPSPEAAAGVQSTQQYSLTDKWNMISVPLTVDNYSPGVLFPTSVSRAFAYLGSYVPVSALTNGTGYWLKFNGGQTVSLSGYLRSTDTVNVAAGWNMIGSLSQSIPVTQVTSIPGGIVTSQFFGYEGKYIMRSTIEQGKGYWVKVNQAGRLVLSSSAAITDKIRIVPGAELPPPPPDVFSDADNAVPNEYALGQNYPNPFNPVTEITYQLPTGGHVTLEVLDMLGQVVATLEEGEKAAGAHRLKWDAGTTSSGIYFYRLQTRGFVDVKKMILVR